MLGNGDDVMFSVTADATGSFDMAGVPHGYFTCDGRDPIANRQSSPVAATVLSSEAINARLPVGAGTTRLAALQGALTGTGSDSRSTVLLSLLFVVFGAGTVFVTRRRRLWGEPSTR